MPPPIPFRILTLLLITASIAPLLLSFAIPQLILITPVVISVSPVPIVIVPQAQPIFFVLPIISLILAKLGVVSLVHQRPLAIFSSLLLKPTVICVILQLAI
jgi:hypothetical protein